MARELWAVNACPPEKVSDSQTILITAGVDCKSLFNSVILTFACGWEGFVIQMSTKDGTICPMSLKDFTTLFVSASNKIDL